MFIYSTALQNVLRQLKAHTCCHVTYQVFSGYALEQHWIGLDSQGWLTVIIMYPCATDLWDTVNTVTNYPTSLASNSFCGFRYVRDTVFTEPLISLDMCW